MRRIHRDNGAFTLVELLVACAILAILAGVAVPTVAVLISSSHEDAAAAELSDVQSAIGSMMAERGLESVAAVTTPTNDMTSFPSVTNPLSGYLRQSDTSGTYTCTSDGAVTQVTTGFE
jgi:prepilin-type N-terminal cleavage/methylation domain-containing protein